MCLLFLHTKDLKWIHFLRCAQFSSTTVYWAGCKHANDVISPWIFWLNPSKKAFYGHRCQTLNSDLINFPPKKNWRKVAKIRFDIKTCKNGKSVKTLINVGSSFFLQKSLICIFSFFARSVTLRAMKKL